MIVNGITCGGYSGAFSNTPAYINPIKSVKIMNSVFDAMHMADLTVTRPYTSMEKEWDLDTIMHADFKNDAAAGNVNYSVYQSSALRIKRRRLGSNNWITIKQVPVNKPEDFSFFMFDILAKSNTTYEYAIVPVIDTIEGAIVSKQIESKFDGIYISNGDQSYHSVMDVSNDKSRTNTATTLPTLGGKYPYVVKNSKSNFSEGNIKAFFVPVAVSPCGHTVEGAIPYREKLDDFLTSQEAKILKDALGRMWIVQVIDGVVETMDAHPDHVMSGFHWVEIGNCESQSDLYDNGFVDTAGV